MDTLVSDRQDFGTPNLKKQVREVWIDALVVAPTGGNSQFTAEVLADDVVKKTLSFDTAGVRTTKRFILPPCRGFRFQMRFTQTVGVSKVFDNSFNHPAESVGLVSVLPRGA